MPQFPSLDPGLRAERLAPPRCKVRLLIDTDAANEIDDQFAIAWALLAPERITVEAATAEPLSFAHHLPTLRASERAKMRSCWWAGSRAGLSVCMRRADGSMT